VGHRRAQAGPLGLTVSRRPQRPLEDLVKDPGFTPGARDLDPLVTLLGADEDAAKHAERALARGGLPALEALAARLTGAAGRLRARIVRALGRFASNPRARDLLVEALEDLDAKTRRNAAIALGHASGAGVQEALLGAWDRDARPEMRRSIAASLGKVGDARALDLLRAAEAQTADPELSRIASRASMKVDRTTSRADSRSRQTIDAERAPATPVDVVLVSRRGIEDVLAEELASIGALSEVRVVGAGMVKARLGGRLAALFDARTWLAVRFPMPTEPVRDGEDPADAIARASTSDDARAVLATWTVGTPRFRVAWAEGGHRRAATWAVAKAIARRAPELVNDPTESVWELLVGTRPHSADVAFVPRALDDPRFAWRKADVPAASHPTLAAALARVAGARAGDVVWDPFVGSGAELVERARLGPFESLVGTDNEPSALVAATENLAAAGVEARLELADALTYTPHRVTLVLTNPPMGRRASRVPETADMLDRFVARAATVLASGGRFVWLAPWPQRARAAGAAAGLRLDWARTVDMGGFDAEMQRWKKQ
jgi:23S rRNA G2445 N2-methylase RlmL